jgi:hypothetical protein
VYYLIYQDDTGVQVRNYAFPGYPYLGRIPAFWIAPPHTAYRIKNYLLKLEGVEKPKMAQIFAGSYHEPLEDEIFINLKSGEGHGRTPYDPISIHHGRYYTSKACKTSQGRSGIPSTYYGSDALQIQFISVVG